MTTTKKREIELMLQGNRLAVARASRRSKRVADAVEPWNRRIEQALRELQRRR